MSLISFEGNMMWKLLRQTIPLYRQRNSNAHDILLCVCDEKQQTYRSWPRLSLRIAQSGILFQVGRRNETAFANLPEAISNISEIVDKKFSIWREKCYFQNLKSGWI
jgi:DNA polymerase-3 subunit alpha